MRADNTNDNNYGGDTSDDGERDANARRDRARQQKKRAEAKGERRERRTRRTSDSGDPESGWSRPAPSRTHSNSRGPPPRVGSRQSSPVAAKNRGDGIDELVARHRDANSDKKNSSNKSVGSMRSSSKSNNNNNTTTKSKKRVSKTAAIASSHDIDEVITQFRNQCDVHMGTLLELKNNITTTEKEVNISTEKDKEFQQVRGWYSALAEKHTKLQKEHQTLQEEHVQLQERYMSLKQASTDKQQFHDSFAANFMEGGGTAKDKKKREKKEKKAQAKLEKKAIGAIVWSRAATVTKKLQTHQQLG